MEQERRTERMPEYKVRFSLEHKLKAFKECNELIQKIWKDKVPFYRRLKEENIAWDEVRNKN